MTVKTEDLIGSPRAVKLLALGVPINKTEYNDEILLDILLKQKDEIELLKKEVKILKGHVGIGGV